MFPYVYFDIILQATCPMAQDVLRAPGVRMRCCFLRLRMSFELLMSICNEVFLWSGLGQVLALVS